MAIVKKSKGESSIGAIYEKGKEIVGSLLAGAAAGAVIGAAASVVAGDDPVPEKAGRGSDKKTGKARSATKTMASKPAAKTKPTSKASAAKKAGKPAKSGTSG